MRYCECGRELEFRQRVCSECRAVNIQISQSVALHNYFQSETFREYRKGEKYRTYMKEYMRKRRAL